MKFEMILSVALNFSSKKYFDEGQSMIVVRDIFTFSFVLGSVQGIHLDSSNMGSPNKHERKVTTTNSKGTIPTSKISLIVYDNKK